MFLNKGVCKGVFRKIPNTLLEECKERGCFVLTMATTVQMNYDVRGFYYVIKSALKNHPLY